MTHAPVAPGAQPPAVRGAACACLLVAAGTAATLALLPFEGIRAPVAGLVVLGAIAAVLLGRLADFHPHPRFGLANAVTLVRAGATAILVALAVEPARLAAPGAAWGALGLALAVLALDGIDGWLARRQGLASAFGARFDMEIDALLILALAGLAVGLGKAGPWILASGLLRYAFIAAGWLVPTLAAPLPPSARRKAVCVLQIVALSLLLAPPLVPPASSALAAAALAALVASFAADIVRLVRPVEPRLPGRGRRC